MSSFCFVDKMSLQPMMRSKLSGLKAERDEEMRCQQIQRIIHIIYNSVINLASTSTNTSYKKELELTPFIITNMQDILSELRVIFPDCLVKNTLCARGNDGQIYDISKIDEKMLAFINKQQSAEYIVVDWS